MHSSALHPLCAARPLLSVCPFRCAPGARPRDEQLELPLPAATRDLTQLLLET